MILGKDFEEIVKLAVEYQGPITDGVVQYDYTNGKLFGAGFTTGTIENPANPFIEVFRLRQGEDGQIDMKCHENGDCPFWVTSEDDYCGGHFDEDFIDEYGDDRIHCCMYAYITEYFEDDFENNFKQGVESQIRDVLYEYLGETLTKLDNIRIECSDVVAPWDYINVRQDNWKMRTIDLYVDNALEHGIITTECTPIEYLDAEVQWLSNYQYNDNELLQKVANIVEQGKLDEALELFYK